MKAKLILKKRIEPCINRFNITLIFHFLKLEYHDNSYNHCMSTYIPAANVLYDVMVVIIYAYIEQ